MNRWNKKIKEDKVLKEHIGFFLNSGEHISFSLDAMNLFKETLWNLRKSMIIFLPRDPAFSLSMKPL